MRSETRVFKRQRCTSQSKDIYKGPSRTVFCTESDSVVCYSSVVNLLRIVIYYSKYSKSIQNVVIHYIFSSESLRVVNSLRILFLVCRVFFGLLCYSLVLDSVLGCVLRMRVPKIPRKQWNIAKCENRLRFGLRAQNAAF